MLYVFIVSSGTMMKFDMNLAVKKVRELKAEIQSNLQIPSKEQVLLCSGGEELQEGNIVGNYYGAGTDTNPIFLFRKHTEDCKYTHDIPVLTSIDLGIEDDVQGCANMTPSANTATVRAALSRRFAEAAAKGRRECDELVQAQHLQQQGWAAVIANLEDAKDTLFKRMQHCEEVFKKYLSKRSQYQEIIKTFPQDIELLAKIPLLPKLLPECDLGDEAASQTEHTLLSWFCTEPRSYLDTLVEKCQRPLEEFNEHYLSALNEEVANVLMTADKTDIKEVKGIEERLSLLNKQIEEAKKLEKEQRDMAAWFTATQNRISRDPGVLPDLCGTFQKQLLLMLDNHKCLRDILERCTKAKLELSENINYRIQYISAVENRMYDLQNRINILEKYVQSILIQIESFNQVHLAPARYMQLLAEVCRRKVFSSNYMKWATELSTQTQKLYEKEVSIRQGFDREDLRNMVDSLFPGMEDLPPPFAITCPEPFDQNLPNVVPEDLDTLKMRLPELADLCEILPPDPMPYISQAESDSAFSSNIPSSRIVGDLPDVGGSVPEKGLTSSHKLAAPSGDFSTLPSEYASMPNEVFSLTSSPFEDPLLPNHQLDSALKQHKGSSFETSAEKALPICEVESDGEEFETVDHCGPSVETRPCSSNRKRSSSAPRPNSTSEVMNINLKSTDKGPKLAKARSDGDAISPIQERLKSESLLVSTDFQSTEYYIDDSMPSSYTESNATSPLLRGNRMVKSHHVVMAELQKQVEEKDGALVGATSSLKNRCNILKLHAKLTALQKFIQELHSSLHSDLANLKTFVKEEFWERMAEVSLVIEKINTMMIEMQKQTEAEKEEAISKAKIEAQCAETNYLNQLEVQCQKLNDAESQITNYEDYIHQILSNLDEIKQEKEMMESELNNKKDVIQSMMLEYELEMDALRIQMRQEVQARDDEILKLKQDVSVKESEMQNLIQQTDSLKEDLKKQTSEKEAASSLLEQKEADFSEKLKDLKQLQEEIRRLQDKDLTKEASKNEEKIQFLELELEQSRQKLSELTIEMEGKKAKELRDLEEKLVAQHRSEMESLRSRYKLAMSTTSMEKSTTCLSESPKAEVESISEDVLQILAEKRKIWQAEKDECIRALQEQHEAKCKEEVEEAISRFTAEKIKSIRRDVRRECEEKSRSRLYAELQISFNEAINSVTKEKDSVIENLRSKIENLENNLASIKFHVDKCFAEATTEAVLSQSDSGASISCRMFNKDDERLLQRLRKEIEPFLQLLEQGPSSALSENEHSGDCLKKNKLPDEIKVKTCVDCRYKVSCFSCEVGDLIILCYEEKYDSFVAFHLGSFIHFLHPDSLQDLGLKIPADPRAKWTLGVITAKEFCVARKPSNRYKMSVGTRFYRVKVAPWDKEKANKEFQFHRTSHSSQSLSASSSASEEVAKDLSTSAI